MSATFEYDIYLSYNSKDKPRVRRLAERLKSAGLRVWFDEWIIKNSDASALKTDEALEQSRALLLCISPNALASGWVALERSTAFHRDPTNEGRRFIPLLLTDCELPETLRRYKVVDLREEAEAGFVEIIKGCRTKTQIKRSSATAVCPIQLIATKRTMTHDWIDTAGVNSDGTWVVSGSGNQTVTLWDLETTRVRVELNGHDDRLRAVAITADGATIVTASGDSLVRVWDALSGVKQYELVGHRGSVEAVVTAQDGSAALSTGCDGTLRLWDIRNGTSLKVINPKIRSDVAFSCALDQQGNRALSGHRNGEIEVWEISSGRNLATLRGHRGIVNSIGVTRDCKSALSSSSDGTIKIWDLTTFRCVGTLEGHKGPVKSATIFPDETLIASIGGEDKTLRIWDRRGACVQVIDLAPNTPISLSFSAECSNLMVALAYPHSVLVYRLTGIRPIPSGETTRHYVNAKIVLLGEGGVGKTSLAHRLIEDNYVVGDRTHGMNVWRLDLPLAPDTTLDREALLWDLAGQEDYRLIHPLFLQETALALLLVNPQTTDPFRETGDWLKMLKSAANEQADKQVATQLLILSQVDVGRPKLSDAKLDQFCRENSFKKWLLTSAKTGENCSDNKNGGQPSKLKQLITNSIPWDKLEWTSTPRLLAELKNAVVAMRDEQDIRLLRFAELTQRLEQMLLNEKIGESDVRTAVTLLANHGLALRLKFGDLVLLQPELLNGYAAAIIRAARAHTDEIGCVLEADVYGPGFDFTGVERLKHRPDEELLLRALVQTLIDRSLCIAEDTPHGRHLVFPSQYRREKDIPRDPDVFVSYSFSGEWQTVWTTLIVRLWYSQEFRHRELWRNAAEFGSPKDYMLGLKIENRQGEGTATISFYFDKNVGDELKSLFIEYGHRHLARYAMEVSRDRRYVCPACGKPVKDHDEVRERLAAGKAFISCQRCDEKVPLIDFIEQRLKSDPVARKILAMDEVTTRELDTQALEQILIGHMMAIAGEANQIFRPVTMFDHGIDGEVEFKDDDGRPSGKRIYIQLKSGNSYLRTRKGDSNEIFDVTNERHLDYWINQPVDVYLVIRQTDDISRGQVIRWMNVARYLRARKDKKSRQIVFTGDKLDMEAVWKVRDEFFPPERKQNPKASLPGRATDEKL